MTIPTGFEVPVVERKVHYRAFDLNGAAMQLLGFSADIFGWALENPSGSVAASIDLYDSADGSGTVVFPIKLATNGVDTRWFGPNGVRFENALYANVTAGEVKGSVFFRHVRQ